MGDIIVGGALDARGCITVLEKLQYLRKPEQDALQNLLLNEPRGQASMNTNLDPRATAGFLIVESDERATISGSISICTVTILLETGMIPMREPITTFSLDTAAGLVGITAKCQGGKCRTVLFNNVPSFV